MYCKSFVNVQKSFQLVDIPGFDKVRYRVLDKYTSAVAAIVFIVDSTTIQKDIRDVAE
jgi:signal recognition particle receptor subunit beta